MTGAAPLCGLALPYLEVFIQRDMPENGKQVDAENREKAEKSGKVRQGEEEPEISSVEQICKDREIEICYSLGAFCEKPYPGN